MSKTVTIYGAGVAGVKLANALQHRANVRLVSPIDYFEVPMAMPRNLVEPTFAERSVVPLESIKLNVEHIRGRLISFRDNVGVVETASGERLQLSSDVSALATGSRYANTLTRSHTGNANERRNEFETHAQRLRNAQQIVIVGGGPIGIELAGEISQDYPSKQVIIVESGLDILNGTSRKVSTHALQTLKDRGVEIHLNQRIIDPDYGIEPEGGVARTDSGLEIPFDLIFWAVGSKPNTGYFPSDQLSEGQRIPVDQFLRVKNTENVFALGDITNLDEVKKAIYLNDQVKVASRNIEAVLAGRHPSKTYKAQTDNDIMVVTLGRKGGVGHLPGLGAVKSNWLVRMFKAKDMLVSMYRKSIGAVEG